MDLLNLLLNALGLLLFLFLFWKRLKDDYTSNQIFSTAFVILFALVVTSILAVNFFPSLVFWINAVGVSVGLTIGVLRYKLRVYESVEAVVISLLPWIGLRFLSDSITNSVLPSLIASLVILVLILLFFIFDKHYKRFSWYKSGRVGFAGLTVLGIFFLIRAIVAAAFGDVLSFWSVYDTLLSGVAAFIAFLTVFNLAQKSA